MEGGFIDTDWGSLSLDPAETGLERN